MHIILLLLSLNLATFGQSIENGWKGIRPLQTNKTTVDRILGTPEIEDDGYHGYKTAEAFIRVNYSSSPCESNPAGRGKYAIPTNTVLDYDVILNKEIRLSEFRFNRQKYRRIADGDVINFVYYYDEEDGIMLTARIQEETEYVRKIDFRPASSEIEKYKCKFIK
jgi:hypothetical protein